MSNTRSAPRLLQVQRIKDLSPHLRCITLGGAALCGFPVDSEGWHIKLMLPQAHQSIPVLPTLGEDGRPIWPSAELRPITRTYSVARYDAELAELDVLFVLHGNTGPASRWATQAQIGNSIGVAGPAAPALFQAGATGFVLIGDLSALALIAAVLRHLPFDAQGDVLIEIPDAAEQQDLIHPAQMNIRWLIRNKIRAGESKLLLRAVQNLRWQAGVSVTLAGENQQVVAIRDYLLHSLRLPRGAFYAVPYWKDQFSEEAYHQERHRIMDELQESKSYE